jgi:UDP-N-acetylglucosamine--N-acetylmuramyl-(pentapeptide) pyrophosphoryl-undecaprenol N-acetylglucosamine transferase
VLLPQAKTDAAGLAGQLEEVLMHPEKLKAMGVAARQLARPDATRRVVDICLEVAHG